MRTNISDLEINDLCKKIAELTDINDHTGAKKTVCGFLGYDDLYSVLDEIEKLHDKAGFISDELCAIRNRIHRIMLQNIYSDYCTSVYESIKNAF